MVTRALLVAVVVAAPIAGCLDTSIEACGGTGDEIASASGQLSPENETFEVPVTYEGNGSGIAASVAWQADDEIEGNADVRIAEDPGETSNVGRFGPDQGCRGWGGVAAGDYTVEVYYDGDEDEGEPGPGGSPASPPTTIDVDVLVQTKE